MRPLVVNTVKLLVHPTEAITFENLCNHNLICGKHPETMEQRELLRQELLKRWEDTIGEVERNPKSLLVLVRYENTGAKRSERIKKLFSNAKSRLKSRVIFLPHLSGGAPPPKNFDEIVKTALKNRGIQIHSQTQLEGFGFYAHICVEKGLYNLGELLGIPQEHWTINMSKSVGDLKVLERHGIKWV